MKYIDHVVNPNNVDLKFWQLHQTNGFTFILPLGNVNINRNHSILFHEHKKEKIIMSTNPVAQHGQQLDVLFKYLKLPKDTPHIDCLMGMHFHGYTDLSWGRTVAPNPKDVLYDVSYKELVISPKELTSKELILTKFIEKTFNNYLNYAKKICDAHEKGKPIKFKIEEIIPKVKRPAKRITASLPKPKIKPIRRINRI